MGQQLLPRILFGLVVLALVLTSSSVHGDEEEKKKDDSSSSITGLGIRKLIGSSIRGIFNMTTTTTPKPTGIIDQAKNFFKDTQKKSQIILDPRKALENKIKEVLTG